MAFITPPDALTPLPDGGQEYYCSPPGAPPGAPAPPPGTLETAEAALGDDALTDGALHLLAMQGQEHRRQLQDWGARLGQLAASLGDPLTQLINPLHLALEDAYGPVPSGLHAQLVAMHRHVRQIHQLADQMADLSLLMSGEPPCQEDRYDLVVLLKDLLGGLERQARWKRVAVQFVPDEPTLPSTCCARTLTKAWRYLSQYLLHLTPSGGTLHIQTASWDLFPEQQRTIVFSNVSPPGGGALPKADPLTDEAVDALGLEVFLAKQFILRIGGRLEVTQTGEGRFAFLVRLPSGPTHTGGDGLHAEPRVWVSPQATAVEAMSLFGPDGPGLPTGPGHQAGVWSGLREGEPILPSRPAVLIVVGDAVQSGYLESILGGDHRVEVATGVSAAMAQALHLHPDIIVCEHHPPDLDACMLLQRLQSQGPLAGIPVILITAQRSERLKVLTLEAGAMDYLVKPFSAAVLRAKIHNLMAFEHREREARAEAREAQLEMLRYQLNPHFLFNALNSIRALVLIDAARARYLVTELSEYLRYTLKTSKQRDVPLMAEIDLVRNYLQVEKIRFEENLQIHFEVEAGTTAIRVPSLLLQPLVENAIKYGMRTSPMPLQIAIRAHRHGLALQLSVANTGRWVSGCSDDTMSTGIGLSNIRERLDRFCPDQYALSFDEEEGWVRVGLRINLPESHA